MPTDDAVWERVLLLMPTCDCGQQLQPGGDPVIGHVLVCTSCSFIGMADPEWVADLVQRARDSLASPGGPT